ncbi:DUF1003 domain-containing protein [Caulobacter mirabilis]|uniref:Cyclic nucleotide-binding protein n=1 Tax=Caulobacter mirabilis TaxID=69666 RepID=A0A2D2AU49_9CAUL|nr:DUF1003 domain-containing protein [Caulobacter mirabilis]ATQ41529.1 hypothetical protein CSW64_03425 [Caulobacter mirabilis]
MSDSRRDQLSRQLLDVAYADLPPIKQSVIDLMVDERPTSMAPGLKGKDGSFWERLADQVAAVGGSWGFIFSFLGVLLGWMALNLLLATKAFDPYPFIFLNLMLSMLAAIQAPVIMMSQNRQAAKDRQAAEHDYTVNLRAELEIMRLHDKLDALRQQEVLDLVRCNNELLELLKEQKIEIAALRGR